MRLLGRLWDLSEASKFVQNWLDCPGNLPCTDSPGFVLHHLDSALVFHLPSKFVDWSHIEEIAMLYCASVEIQVNKCKEHEVCKLFALTGGAVTCNMLEIS